MYKREMEEIYRILSHHLNRIWDGKDSILEMKDNGSNQWRQMEWPGFYFQYVCEMVLKNEMGMEIPGPRYGNVEFDGFKCIPWDFKAHSIDIAKPDNEKIPTNGYEETCQAINEFGTVGFIIISGISEYDDDFQSFKIWHDRIKGGTSDYEIERINRGANSRRRKVNFDPQALTFVFLDNNNIDSCGKFQSNFRNSNGVGRNSKVLLDLRNNDDLIKYKFPFN